MDNSFLDLQHNMQALCQRIEDGVIEGMAVMIKGRYVAISLSFVGKENVFTLEVEITAIQQLNNQELIEFILLYYKTKSSGQESLLMH